MTGDKQLFKSVTKLDGGTVTFGDKSKGNVIGVGKVPLSSTCDVDEVYLVDELGYNLLSISQLCDNDYEVHFKKHGWFIEDESGNRDRNVYTIKNLETFGDRIYLTSMVEDPWVWHRKLGHASMHTIQKLSKHDLVIGLPKLDFSKDHICDACQLGKQTRSSFKIKNIVSTSKPLQLLHMDLFGPTRTASIGGKKYAFVIVDDFSRFTWVMFLSHKDDALKNFEVFCKKVQREKGYYISTIRSDHGGEFESRAFENFCNDQGISHNFSSPRSPQQNGVVERKNRTLQDMARTMIVENSLPHHFWAEAVSTACHIINRCLIRPILKKTPYELWNGKKPNISYFHPFGYKCFIHNNGKDNLGKFDPKSDEGIFLGYSPSSRAYRVYNKRTLCIEESIHVVFVDTNPRPRNEHIPEDEEISCAPKSVIVGKDHQNESANQQTQSAEVPPEDLDLPQPDQSTTEERVTPVNTPNEWKSEPGYPHKFIIGDPQEGITTRRSQKNKSHVALISQIEPKKVDEALKDSHWISAMKEELDQFERNKVWELIPKPQNSSVVGTKWVFRNKLNESGQVVRNKARLVAQGYSQQ